jgi:5-formyltetrahydrofolate cyclo-ligase
LAKKQELRAHFSELRSRLSPATIKSFSQSICLKTETLPIWNYRVFHCFLSRDRGDEVDTSCILQALNNHNKEICVPRIEGRGVMSARVWQEETPLIQNKYGIPEPSEQAAQINEDRIEVVFVPLLAFDKKGSRLGYGGGFYDRLWEACSPDSIWVGLSLLEASSRPLPSEIHDLKLDYALTPNRIHEF